MNDKPTLYMIPMELGEGADHVIPEYVKEILFGLNNLVCENLKTTRRYMRRIGFKGDFDAMWMEELNKRTKKEDLLSFIDPLRKGESMGVISESGCPGIADPGSTIAALAHREGYPVKPLVGPSSIFLALMASGLNGQSFLFHGYLPIEVSDRKKKLIKMELSSGRNRSAQIFMETPYRNNQMLDTILRFLKPETKLCIACNLTLEDEMVRTQNLEAWKKDKPDLHKKPCIFILTA